MYHTYTLCSVTHSTTHKTRKKIQCQKCDCRLNMLVHTNLMPRSVADFQHCGLCFFLSCSTVQIVIVSWSTTDDFPPTKYAHFNNTNLVVLHNYYKFIRHRIIQPHFQIRIGLAHTQLICSFKFYRFFQYCAVFFANIFRSVQIIIKRSAVEVSKKNHI